MWFSFFFFTDIWWTRTDSRWIFYCQTFSELFWGGGGLNPPQRPPYVLERLETEEMKVGGGKWMGRGKRSCFFPLAVTYHVVTITITIGGERRWNHDVCSLISLLWLKPQLFGLSGRRVNVACHAGVLRVFITQSCLTNIAFVGQEHVTNP